MREQEIEILESFSPNTLETSIPIDIGGVQYSISYFPYHPVTNYFNRGTIESKRQLFLRVSLRSTTEAESDVVWTLSVNGHVLAPDENKKCYYGGSLTIFNTHEACKSSAQFRHREFHQKFLFDSLKQYMVEGKLKITFNMLCKLV